MVGVWIEPVTAQLMIILLDFWAIRLSRGIRPEASRRSHCAHLISRNNGPCLPPGIHFGEGRDPAALANHNRGCNLSRRGWGDWQMTRLRWVRSAWFGALAGAALVGMSQHAGAQSVAVATGTPGK